MRNVAIVEDEVAIRDNYADVLIKQGYNVQTYGSRPEAMEVFEQKLPDLVLLDIGLGDEIEGGFELCRSLRRLSTTIPIIFLTARDNDLDTISGLRLGADDYLTKDISLPNLCARVAAFFRRLDLSNEPHPDEELVTRGDLVIDMNRLCISWNNTLLDLSLTEFWIIHALARRPGHVKNREQLMQEAKIVVDDTTITAHIKRIRKKFQHVDKNFNKIDTVYGMGYRWMDNPK